VSGINGRFGQPGITPVEYLHRSISRAELVAFYRRADVMLVTSLRDGMNLVAQEFAFCQSVPGLPRRWNGALLLSELAGAANVLAGAVLVNPWHVGGIADKLEEALSYDAAERERRLATMAERVRELDSRRWARRFLERLRVYARRRARLPSATLLSAEAGHGLARSVGQARRRTLLLDYDGTLRELVTHPELAAPTPEIIGLLRDLAALPATEVHLVSGRDRGSMERWFGDVPIWLCAEHGYAVRAPGEAWRELVDVDLSWLPRFERLLRGVAADVPGTMVERKACSVAWHYRQAEPEYGGWRARELLMSIEQLLPGVPAEILVGHRVVEVRARGVSKGGYVASLFPRGRDRQHAVLAIGDDLTDQEMYAALPPGAVSVHVGTRRPVGPSRHQHLIPEPSAARRLLREVVVETLRHVDVPAA
jgi:trehalose 6-phosphate synthase/phosphatase